MIKRKRELYKLAEREGLQRVAVFETGGNHYRIEGHHNGRLIKVITPYSPSCHRSEQNLRGNIRRAIKSVDTPVVMRYSMKTA